MKFLIASIDSASFDAGLQLQRHLRGEGHEVEVVAYNHLDDMVDRMILAFESEGVPTHAPIVLRAITPDEFFERRSTWTKAERRQTRMTVLSARFIMAYLGLHRRLRLRQAGLHRWLNHVLGLSLGQATDRVIAGRLLDDVKPDAVVLLHDFIGHFTTVLAKVGRKRGYPIVLKPALIPQPKKLGPLLARRPANLVSHRLERLIAWARPRWVVEVEGQKVFRLPSAHLVALELNGLATRKPWVHQFVTPDLISLPDADVVKTYAALGFDTGKMRVHADLRDEAIGDAASPDIAANGRPVLVVAVPPNQYDGDFQLGAYTSHQEMLGGLKAYLDALAADYHIVITRHPKDPPETLSWLGAQGYPAAEMSTRDALAHAAAFLTYRGSATVRWGHNYNVATMAWNPFGYDDIAEIPGDVALCDDPAAARNAMQDAATNLAAHQASAVPKAAADMPYAAALIADMTAMGLIKPSKA